MLDLFAGTGAIGIEAISRGAEHVTFVERARATAAVLRRNLDELDLVARSRLLAVDVRSGVERLRREGKRFDLIFADPPWGGRNDRAWGCWLAREAGLEDLLAPEGVLVLERATEMTAPVGSEGVEQRGSKTYGGTSFDWYERREGMSE